MKLRCLGMFLALAATVLVTMACGGGDNIKNSATATNSPSSSVTDQALKDYFQQLSTILTGVDAQMKQLGSQYPSAGEDPDQTRQFLAQFLPIFTNELSGIKSLNPPSTVRDLHDKFVSSLGDLLTAETSLSDDLQSINSATDMKAYLDSHESDFAAKTDLVNGVCSDLQTVANSNNIGIGLKCKGAASPAPSLSGSGQTPTPDSGFDAWLRPGTEVRFGISDPSKPIEAASGLRVVAVDYGLQRIDFALIGPYSGPLPRDIKIGTEDLKGVCQVLRVTSPAGDTGMNLSAGQELVFTVEYACEKGTPVRFVGLFGIIFESP